MLRRSFRSDNAGVSPNCSRAAFEFKSKSHCTYVTVGSIRSACSIRPKVFGRNGTRERTKINFLPGPELPPIQVHFCARGGKQQVYEYDYCCCVWWLANRRFSRTLCRPYTFSCLCGETRPAPKSRLNDGNVTGTRRDRVLDAERLWRNEFCGRNLRKTFYRTIFSDVLYYKMK